MIQEDFGFDTEGTICFKNEFSPISDSIRMSLPYFLCGETEGKAAEAKKVARSEESQAVCGRSDTVDVRHASMWLHVDNFCFYCIDNCRISLYRRF